ncbi:MAG: universal stress protein [Bacteroidales bacterium]|nr:universal stress protein [Bacteroidales bacterium]
MLKLCVEIDEYISNGDWPSVNYSYSLREGQVDEEVENFVLEYKPSLLVLGTKGLDNTSSILGNVTADIIEIINVPVLAIPINSPINSIADIEHIVFLSTLQNKEMPSFNRLLEIFKPYPNIKITLLHINQINRKGDKWTNEELAKISQSFEVLHPQLNINYKLIDSEDIALALSNFIMQENVSIISLNTRRRNLFSRIFYPSKSRKLLRFSDKALFVLRG